MRQIGNFIICMFLLISCSSQQEMEDAVRLGELQLDLSSDSLSNFTPVMTKAAPEYVDLNELKVVITNVSGQAFFEGTYKELKSNGGKGLPLSLPVGDYKTVVSFNMDVTDTTKANLYGESDFSIYYNTLTRVKVVCEYKCIKVALQTSGAFDTICKDNYKVALSTTGNESVVLSKESPFVFFRKECSSMKAVVSVETTDGRQISYEYELAKKDGQSFKFKDSAIIKLDIQNTKSLKLETVIQ